MTPDPGLSMTDIINAEAANGLGDSETSLKSKKPSNSAFKQQRLAAWQPILTAGTVLPTFFVIGILFIPVGIGLWYFSESVKEVVIPYTDCKSVDAGVAPGTKCSEVIAAATAAKPGGGAGGLIGLKECNCEETFTLHEPFKGKVFMYYALTNFYQNHRRYVKSRDDAQLFGGEGEASKECIPFQKVDGKTIWPCGAIANSMFQDVITLYQNGKQHKLENTGIAWETDKQFKFKNPKNWNSTEFQQKYIQPKAWIRSPWQLDPENSDNNGLQNEDFIVWMRTAALPNFRKLYRIVNQNEPGFRDGMPKGNYTLKIKYSYPVTLFQGTKSIVFSTTSLLGGKNSFLGIAYVVMGCVCLVLGIVFLFVHINYGKSTWEMTNVDTRTTF